MVGSESVFKKLAHSFQSKKCKKSAEQIQTVPDMSSSETTSMELIPPPKDVLEKILQDINLNTEQHKRDTQTLKEWLKAQPHLPHDLDDRLLGAFIVGCKNSLERAKQCLDNYLSNRNSCRDFYQDRDPCSPAFQKLSSVMLYFPLPQITPEGYRVTCIRLVSPDITGEDFDLRQFTIKILCSYDIRFLEDHFWAGDILIVDCFQLPLSLLPAVANLALLKKCIHCVMNSLPLRFKKMIYINLAPVVEITLTMIRPIMKKKIVQRIITTTEDHTFLYNHVPRDMLPVEYGGKAGKLQDLNDAWQLKVESYRNWFLKDMNRNVEESLRPEKNKYKSKEMFGLEGSFKKLDID